MTNMFNHHAPFLLSDWTFDSQSVNALQLLSL